MTIPITLRHGDIVRLEGIASAAEFSSTQNSADASGSYSIWVDPIPGVLRLIPANCPPL